MAGYDAQVRLGLLREHLDEFKKLAIALAGLHGLGLGYCISILKESPPQLSVGIFVLLFGVGFLLAGVLYLVAAILKVEVPQAIISGRRPGKGNWWGIVLNVAGWIGMCGSVLALFVAIGLFIYRFS
jgi:hypothetical protein